MNLEEYHGPSRPLLPDTQEVAQAGWKNTCSSYFSYLHDRKPDGTAEGQEMAFQLRVSPQRGVKKKGHRYKQTPLYCFWSPSPLKGCFYSHHGGFLPSVSSLRKKPPQTNPVFWGILNPVKVTMKPEDHKVRSERTWQ